MPLPNAGHLLEDPVLSGDGGTVAVALGSDDGPTTLVTVDTATGELTLLPSPADQLDGGPAQLRGLRWTGAAGGGLVAADNRGGLLVHADGGWHQVDPDPLRAARAVGFRTQVLLTGPPGDPELGGELYLLHRRPYGSSGNVYAHPSPSDQPIAEDVTMVQVRPNELGERPFVVEPADDTGDSLDDGAEETPEDSTGSPTSTAAPYDDGGGSMTEFCAAAGGWDFEWDRGAPDFDENEPERGRVILDAILRVSQPPEIAAEWQVMVGWSRREYERISQDLDRAPDHDRPARVAALHGQQGRHHRHHPRLGARAGP